MGSSCRSVVSDGYSGTLIDIECHLSRNLPTMVIVGFAGRAVHEAKDRLRGAFASAGLALPRQRITINLAPADLPKSESCLDIGIASAIIAAAYPTITLDASVIPIGELGLDGTIRPVRGIIGKLLAARQHGLCSFFVPKANLEQASLVPGITLIPVANLVQYWRHISGEELIPTIDTGAGRYHQPHSTQSSGFSLDDIAGQDIAKRAVIIAAAGGHNLFMQGPPGTGKSMLAKTLPSLLPPLNHEEVLQVTHLHSLVDSEYSRLNYQRPLRSPHHSINHTAMVGGGQYLLPGEISLSHRGVLLLDELTEFDRPSIESLRQPLEDHTIHINRTRRRVQYPANFMLVATANPCPCGYYGFSINRCDCTEPMRRRYNSKLSGPVLDRIDLCCDVYEVDHARLMADRRGEDMQQQAQADIGRARAAQAERYGNGTLLNSSLSSRQVRQYCALPRPALLAMQDAAHRLELSARGYMRSLMVARTIADLAGATHISPKHISEALSYRRRGR